MREPDLEAAIAAWRARWRRRLPRARRDALAELEDHLRCRIEDLRRGGATPERAVREAMRALGDARAVGAELAKVPAARQPWLPARLVLAGAAALGALAVAAGAPRAAAPGPDALLGLHMILFALGGLATLCLGTLAAAPIALAAVCAPRPAQRRGLRAIIVRVAAAAVLLLAAGLAVGVAYAGQTGGSPVNAYLLGGAVILAGNVAVIVGQRRPA